MTEANAVIMVKQTQLENHSKTRLKCSTSVTGFGKVKYDTRVYSFIYKNNKINKNKMKTKNVIK